MTEELFHHGEVVPVAVLVMVQLSPPLPGGNARLEVVFKGTISISHGALDSILVQVDQV